MMLSTHYDLLFLEPILEYLNSGEGQKLRESGKEPASMPTTTS